jgi:hypothetical protein
MPTLPYQNERSKENIPQATQMDLSQMRRGAHAAGETKEMKPASVSVVRAGIYGNKNRHLRIQL